MCKVRCGWYKVDTRQRYYGIYTRSNSGIGIKPEIILQAWPLLVTFLGRISELEIFSQIEATRNDKLGHSLVQVRPRNIESMHNIYL
jgi:hypothetical protein